MPVFSIRGTFSIRRKGLYIYVCVFTCFTYTHTLYVYIYIHMCMYIYQTYTYKHTHVVHFLPACGLLRGKWPTGCCVASGLRAAAWQVACGLLRGKWPAGNHYHKHNHKQQPE